MILCGLRKNQLDFTTCPFFKNNNLRFSLEAFSNLHSFILTNLILKHTKRSNYQKSRNNNLNNETKF